MRERERVCGCVSVCLCVCARDLGWLEARWGAGGGGGEKYNSILIGFYIYIFVDLVKRIVQPL